MKKLTMIFMVVLIFFMPIFNTFNQQTAHANIISKPLTITAKKVAKELAQNTAVEMAEHILFEKAMSEFLNTDMTDPGYKAVCLEGAKSFDDCSPDKRAQVKETLTSSDKSKLASKVESVLEQKTNTSSKWTKFLDWFIPIFLVSGLVATFDSMMNPDSEGLIDDIAQQALLETGLLKELKQQIVTDPNARDFTNYITSATAINNDGNIKYSLQVSSSAPSLYLKVGETNYLIPKGSVTFILSYTQNYTWSGGSNPFYPRVTFNYISVTGTNHTIDGVKKVIMNDKLQEFTSANNAGAYARAWWESHILSIATYGKTVNENMNGFLQLANMGAVPVSFNVPFLNPPHVPIDVGQQPGIQHIKNPDGTVTTPGIEQFKYRHGQNEIYPSPDSTTGWKEKNTHEDIQVVEDEISVDTELDAPPTEEEEEEEFPSCKKNLKKIEFKKVGTAFTNAFPFSIPWDIKRFIDASFGGVGDTKPSFSLPDYLGGVKLEIPAFFDGWIGFMRTFIVIMFDISLVYLFYRIMRGGGGD